MSTSKTIQDSAQRIAGERHAGIVIKDGKILLVHRIKNGYEYHVFPGGHRREGELGQNTVIREILEETSMSVTNPKLVFEFKDYKNNNTDYYYFCTWVSGDQPKLNGEEALADPKLNFYGPMWVSLNEIGSLNILPKFAKFWLQDYLDKYSANFSQ